MGKFLVSSKFFGTMLKNRKIKNVNEVRVEKELGRIIIHTDDDAHHIAVEVLEHVDWAHQQDVNWEKVRDTLLKLPEMPVLIEVHNNCLTIKITY